MILVGSSGYAFFIQETLLSQGLAQRVDLVNSVEEAKQKIEQGEEYDFFIIDLEECWDAGMQIGYEWHHIQRPLRLFLIEPHMTAPPLAMPNIVRVKPTTLAGFINLAYDFCQNYCFPTQIIYVDEISYTEQNDFTSDKSDV